jgi:membrane-bound lytic murein transglycosylase D
MTKFFKTSLGTAWLLVAAPLFAQEPSISTDLISDELQDGAVMADSLAATAGLEEAVPLELLQTGLDGSVEVTAANAPPSKIELRDLDEAARYDSLWMRELYNHASLFDEMYDEVLDIPTDTIPAEVKKVTTEELKERLALLDEKTPFNIAYNPSLETVINSFLVRRKDLMERMLTVSQFYFPMFEEALDKYNLPLEIKYLAIVESALNPRARSRVGATGLWQFMYGTGKMYKLDVSSYVDDRRDPIKATEAACQYLSKL